MSNEFHGTRHRIHSLSLKTPAPTPVVRCKGGKLLPDSVLNLHSCNIYPLATPDFASILRHHTPLMMVSLPQFPTSEQCNASSSSSHTHISPPPLAAPQFLSPHPREASSFAAHQGDPVSSHRDGSARRDRAQARPLHRWRLGGASQGQAHSHRQSNHRGDRRYVGYQQSHCNNWVG